MISVNCVSLQVSRSASRSPTVSVASSVGRPTVGYLCFFGRCYPPPSKSGVQEGETFGRPATLCNLFFRIRLRHSCNCMCIMFPLVFFLWLFFCYRGDVGGVRCYLVWENRVVGMENVWSFLRLSKFGLSCRFVWYCLIFFPTGITSIGGRGASA